jgi:hypothetical protein
MVQGRSIALWPGCFSKIFVNDSVAIGRVVHVFGHEDRGTNEENLFVMVDWFEHVNGNLYRPTVAAPNRVR